MVSLSSTRNIPPNFAYPLDPLTASEIRQTVGALRSYVKSGLEATEKVEKILFNSISLHEPNKYAVLLWAGTFSEKEIRATGASIEPLVRQAEVRIRLQSGLSYTVTDRHLGPLDRPGFG
jgi:Cu2+-containing amine oxidase